MAMEGRARDGRKAESRAGPREGTEQAAHAHTQSVPRTVRVAKQAGGRSD